MATQKYSELFQEFSNNLNVFITEVKKQKMTNVATDQWTVKEVLCHITFWHENYAANYEAMVNNQKPPLFDGLGYELNRLSVSTLKKYPANELIERLRKAQTSLYNSIMVAEIPQMKYTARWRVYTTEEFLVMIGRHFLTHAKQVKRAKEKSKVK
jgi:hypothetical protein